MRFKFLLIFSFFITSCSCYDIEKSFDSAIEIKDVKFDSNKIHATINKKELMDKFFSPWTLDKNETLKKFKEHQENTKEYYTSSQEENYYKENFQLWSESDLSEIKNKFVFSICNGIIIRNSYVRTVPTNKPFFKNPSKAGEGYPFDYAQIDYIYYSSPVKIVCTTSDGSWTFIVTDSYCGWVESNKVRNITPYEIKILKNMRWGVMIDDNTPITEQCKNYVTESRIGALIPISSENKNLYGILLPAENGFQEFQITKNAISKNGLEFNSVSVEFIVRKLNGKPYGWGGYLGNRDCSMLSRDFLRVFNIYLPRNSGQQIKHCKNVIDLSSMNEKEKEKFIVDYAEPYRTLLFAKGHIAIYAGINHHGEPLIFHAIWGIQTISQDNIDGRFIIGKTIVSKADIGKNIPNSNKDRIFFKRISNMAVLP